MKRWLTLAGSVVLAAALTAGAASGGPDSGGYIWKDNVESGGPAVSFVDITTVGTNLGLVSDDAGSPAITLPWSFNYYGAPRTTMYVCNNGHLNFAAASTAYSNANLPASGAPNFAIYPFWDDLSTAATTPGHGSVWTYHDVDNNRFIIEWFEIGKTTDTPNGFFKTFEVILYPGDLGITTDDYVVMQYGTMAGTLNSATVGIEGAGTAGTALAVTYNATGRPVQSNTAIKYWIQTGDELGPTFTHTPLTTSENAGPFTVNANISDATGVVSADLYYRANGGAWTSVAMTPGTPPAFSASIPAQPLGATVEYYLTAADPVPNTSTSSTWTFAVQDYTQPPQTFTASDDQTERVVLAWTAPAWVHTLALGAPSDEPRFEDFLPLSGSKDEAYQAWQAALAQWQGELQGSDRAFVNYKIYRDAVLLTTTTSLTYTDLTAVVGTTYTYGVTAAFTANESSMATDSGVAQPRPTTGGPDAFGYTWINSLDPSGTPINWVDISTTGTEITTFTDDNYTAALPLGINFPFYDAVQTQVYATSNGVLTFNALTTSYAFNVEIPTAAVPNNLIALYWDDLAYTAGTSHAYYLADPANDRFIFQLTNVRKYSAYSPIISVQAILYESGDILLQYLNVDETAAAMNDQTIGIENSTGAVGLRVRYNTLGGSLQDNMTVFIDRPAGDVVAPSIAHTPLGNTEDTVNPYTVTADITDSESNVASATLYYQVNGGGYLSVPMTAGMPPAWSGQIPAQAAGSDVQYYITATDTAVPANSGTSATWAFSVVDISLAPTGLTASDGLLDQVNLAWTAPAWAVAMFGEPAPEPRFEDFLPLHQSKDAAFAAFQTAHAAWLAQGAERSFLNYNIYRDGGLIGTSATTTYIDYAPTADVYTYHVTALFNGGESNASNTDTGFKTLRPTSGGPDVSGYSWINSVDDAGPDYEWIDISGTGTPIAGLTDDGFTGPYALGFTMPYYGVNQTDVFVASNGFLTFGTGNGSLSNTNLPDAATPNSVVAPFWDDMGAHYVGSTIHYLSDVANGRFIVQWHVPPYGAASPYTFLDYQVVLYANGDIKVNYSNLIETDVSEATLGIENSTGTVGLAANYNGAGSRLADGVTTFFVAPLGDWVGPAIAHTPLTNTEDATNPYTVNADITDADNQVASATLYYQVNGGGYQSVAMSAGTPPLYTAQIPAQAGGSDVMYYIVAVDNSVNSNTTTSPTWSFSVVDYTLAPTGLAASDGGYGDVLLTWTAPAWAVAFSSPEPRVEDFLPLFGSKSEAVAAFQTAHAAWLAQGAQRSFLTYNVYRDGGLIGTSAVTNYTDIPPVESQVYTYHVTAQFDAGESAASNTDTGFFVSRPTSGGPDAAGYTWMNSDDPSGNVTYSWTDISAIGDSLDIQGDDDVVAVTLPFAFPFYGTNYTTANVCTNGWLNFGASATAYSNTALPTAGLPDATVAVFWDDMYVPTAAPTGAVYQYNDVANNRVIFQWNNVHPLSSSADRFTFQAVLKVDGTIDIYYQVVAETQDADATVGIENADASVGLQVNFDDVGGRIGDLLALRIKPLIPCGIPYNANVTIASGNANLSWDAVDGAASYKVFAASYGYGPFSQIGTSATTSYTDLGAQAAGHKFYQIVAVCE